MNVNLLIENLTNPALLFFVLGIIAVYLKSDLEILEKYDFNYSYQENKWSIAKLIRHCIDTEQIFGYRALCIARQDPNPIMSFDENQFYQKLYWIDGALKSEEKDE